MTQASRDCQGWLETQDQRETKDHRAFRDQRQALIHSTAYVKTQLSHRDLKVFRVHQARKVTQVQRGRRDLKVLLEMREVLDQRVSLDFQVPQDHL